MKFSLHQQTLCWVFGLASIWQTSAVKTLGVKNNKNRNLRSLQGLTLTSATAATAPIKPEQPVQIEVWTAPQYDWDQTTGDANGPNAVLFDGLRDIILGFGNDFVSLQPRMYINVGDGVCSIDSDGNPLEPDAKQEVCDANCANGHRYCIAPPTDPVHSELQGKMILNEALRRRCIWKVHGMPGGDPADLDPKKYFDYLDQMRANRCQEKSYPEFCLATAFQNSAVDGVQVNACMEKSGGVEIERRNQIFEEETISAEQEGINKLDSLPAILIDGQLIQEQVTLDDLKTKICEKFPAESRPTNMCGDATADEALTVEAPPAAEEESSAAEGVWDLPDAPNAQETDAPNAEETEVLSALSPQTLTTETVGAGEEEEEVAEEEDALEEVEAEDADIDPATLENTDDKLVVEIWTTPLLDWKDATIMGDGPNIKLFNLMKEVIIGFGDTINFRPQILVSKVDEVCVNDSEGRPLEGPQVDQCASENCVNSHRYCMVGPDDWKVTGATLLEEGMRRICLWEVYGRNDDGADDVYFFDYLERFHKLKCDSENYDQACITAVLSGTDIKPDDIDTCIANSGGLTDDNDNNILQAIVDLQGVEFPNAPSLDDLPLLKIGGETISNAGDNSADEMFKLICAKFGKEDEIPDICADNVEENLGEDEDKEEEEAAKEELEEEIEEDLGDEQASPESQPAEQEQPESEAPEEIKEEEAPEQDEAPEKEEEAEEAAEEAEANEEIQEIEEEKEEEESLEEEEETVEEVQEEVEHTESSSEAEESISSTEPETETTARSSEKDGFDKLDMKIVDTAMSHLAVLQKCDVDTEALVSKVKSLAAAETSFKDEIEGIESDIPILMSQQCPHEEGEKLLEKLAEFHRCAKFNLQELIETFPSTATGVMMRCANAYSNMTKYEEEMGYIPEACLRTLEQNSILGRGLFDLYLYPDVACPCFEKLQDEMPACTADVWPIPINGALVKAQSCLAGQYCQSIDGMCEEKFDILDECLPPQGYDPKCDDTFKSCSAIYDHVPPMFTAAPLPDACLRVSHGSKYFGKHIVERYDAFRHKCGENIELWEGHSPIAEFRAFVTDGVMGVDYQSVPFLSGAVTGFLAGIAAAIVFVIVRNFVLCVCRCCRRCYECICCIKKKEKHPDTKDYSTVEINSNDDALSGEYRDNFSDEED